MALEPGARLGPYEIVSPAGAGGMGEVYCARDTRLDRSVAIKVLPPDVTSDSAARQRFEREARAVAALSHPHICTLHDIGQQDGTDFLVMEYLDGETLAQRLTRGKLPLEQALQYGIEIADALAAAHKAGIVHRDLKPGNVMLTKSGAKLLDFGLAKPGVQLVGPGVTELTTEDPLTSAGTLLGTLPYMAPEQLQAHPVDTRADVFAFGCVLYEMITGRRAFAGDAPASVIAAVLDHEPAPLTSSEDVSHPALDAIIRTCLAKNLDDRWSSGRDVWLALRRFGHAGDASATVARPKSRFFRAVVPWVIAGVSLIAALYRPSNRPPTVRAAPAMQAFIEFPNVWLGNPILSPDGRHVAISGTGGRQVLVRRLADGEVTSLAGTEHTEPAVWSPDGRALAVLGSNEVRVVDIATRVLRTVARVPGDWHLGAAWNQDGVILIGGSRLRRLSVAGGHVADVYNPDPEILDQSSPSFLPDGRRFLYAQDSKDPARRGVFLGALDSPQVTRLLPEPGNAVVSARGYLLFGRQGTLFAQRFELETNRLAGDPVSIGSGLGFLGSFTMFDVGGDVLVWANDSVTPLARLTWFDRSGRKLNEIGEVRRYSQIALAPDGRNVAATEEEPEISFSVFLIELARNIHTRLTTGGHYDAVWSPDSREIAFVSKEGLSKRRIDQRAETKLVASGVLGVEDWTHDGRFVIFQPNPRSISAVPLGGDGRAVIVIESPSMVDEPHVSRDGRWLAYSANETGQWEVYVQPFMRAGDRVRVSTSGGSQARWRADGNELFYLTLDGTMMSVDTRDPINPAAPRRLFESRSWVNPVDDQYDVTPDGQRFLLTIPEGPQATRLTVLTNWASLVTGQ